MKTSRCMVLARIALQAALACVQILAGTLVPAVDTAAVQVVLVAVLVAALAIAQVVVVVLVLAVVETVVHRRVEPAMDVLLTAGAVVAVIVGV